ncbi:MAG: hypothetical protein H6713_36435 [Myxococcales bacterium]|nr:hypothetical protein [Myxococcales bacterium]
MGEPVVFGLVVESVTVTSTLVLALGSDEVAGVVGSSVALGLEPAVVLTVPGMEPPPGVCLGGHLKRRVRHVARRAEARGREREEPWAGVRAAHHTASMVARRGLGAREGDLPPTSAAMSAPRLAASPRS